MKKFLPILILAGLFLPAIAAMVLAWAIPPVSFHLTVAKKTVGGDGSFAFELAKQDELIPVQIKSLFSAFASGDISAQPDEFSIFTQNGQGAYSADYVVRDFSGVKLREINVSGWRLKSVVCRKGNELENSFFYNIFDDFVVFNDVRDGDEIYCEFTNEKIKNPVLIVPGLLGTELYDVSGNKLWPNIIKMIEYTDNNFMNGLLFNGQLEPVYDISTRNVISNELFNDYTANLINLLTSSEVGYVLDEDLFTFPYDWRYGMTGKYPDNTDNVGLLKERIEEIIDQTGAQKVDIIAHSLGGLIAKKYVHDCFNSNVGKLIFVGTPNLGSPIAAKAILTGHNFDIAVLSGQKIKEISENMPAAHDLLPSYDYRKNNAAYIKLGQEQADGTFVWKNLDFSESRDFLDDHGANSAALYNANFIHSFAGLDDFDPGSKGADVYKITGCASAMPMQIKATKSQNGQVSYDLNGYLSSDNTVPFGSADSIPAENAKSFYAIKAKHGAMMGQDGVRQTIANILSGANLPVDNNSVVNKNQLIRNTNLCALNGVAVKIHSPVNIEAIDDQSGNRLGLDQDGNPQNDIPGASFEIVDGHKFVYLPQGNGEQYQINLRGTATGAFTLETQIIENDQEKPARTFEDIPVSGSLTASLEITDSQTLLKLDNDGNGIIDETLVRQDETVVGIDSIISDVNDYYQTGAIKTKAAKNLLLAQLKALKMQFAALDRLNDNAKLPAKAKDVAVKMLRKAINKQIDLLVKEIQKMNSKKIDNQAAQSLAGLLAYIKIK